MGTFYTQDSVHILEQHNNSLSQTLQYNIISSLCSHRTDSKVLLLPFIHYRIDPTSTSVVIYNIYFSVGLLLNTHFLVLLIRALSVRSKKRLTSYSIRRWGLPSLGANISSRIAPATDQATTVAEVEADHNNQCNPNVQDFPGSPHYPPQHKSDLKTQWLSRRIPYLTLTETFTHGGKPTKEQRTTNWAPSPTRMNPNK